MGKKIKIIKKKEIYRGERKSSLKTQLSKYKHHGIWSYHFVANRHSNGKNERYFCCCWAPKSLQMMTEAMKLKDACFLEV